MMLRRIKKVNDWTKLVIVLSLLCSVFRFGVNAQTGSEKPLNAQQLANLITGLKGALKENLPVAEKDGKKYASIAQKWEARKNLAGKTKAQILQILFNDCKAVVKDKETQDAILTAFK